MQFWAKKPVGEGEPQYEETLVGHAQRVCEMAQILTDMLASSLMQMSGCAETEAAHWKKAVIIGAWMHDWGKANNHFQKMLRNPGFNQGIRHEPVSLIVAQELGDWLATLWMGLPNWARCAALFSTSGHHLKFPDPYKDSRTGTEVRILCGHGDFEAVLSLKSTELGLPSPPKLQNRTLSLLRSGQIRKTLGALERELDADYSDSEKILIAATKSAVMAADLACSALPSKTPDARRWIKERLGRVLAEDQLAQVVSTKLCGRQPRRFQIKVSETPFQTALVEAGCGSRKTAAAYLWASQNSYGKRLFFSYPTTGTASEGFAGYLSDPDFDAVLIHSRAEIDYRLLENMPSPLQEESDLRQARLEALETWPVPAVVCTAHTVLGLLENVRRGIYAFPALMQSAFIFDEVHAFSKKLFSYLLRFLVSFPGAPVLLMTATLPPAKRKALETACHRRGGLDVITGSPQRESAKRYVVRKCSLEEAWSQVQTCLAEGRKVLRVSNTVGRVMAALDRALDGGLPVHPYHSRYRYKDRLKRHRAVIDGFSRWKPPRLGVTTQVAEMSLDLSADLLVSERAPIPSMIQRMGRLNRFDEESKHLGTALFLEPENMLPYDEESLVGVDEWFHAVADGSPKSQSELANAFSEIASKKENLFEPVPYCEWLDGLRRTLKDQRAIEEARYTIEIIREEDLCTGSRVELAIPMPVPRQLKWREWSRMGRYLAAPSGTVAYDSFRGAEWER